MQQAASRQQPNPNIGFNNKSNNRSTIIAILALLLFALSGLMTGFAAGAFTRPKQTQPQSNNNKTTNSPGKTSATPVQTQEPQVTQTPNIAVVGLGCPDVQYMVPEVLGSSYSVQAQVLDGSGECGKGKPLHVTGITCRLWLTKDTHFGENIPKDRIKSVSTLQDAFPKEEEGALNFINGTTQVQPCDAQGATVWKYQLASSVDEGKYYLMVLADWNGILYNWIAKQIVVTKAG
ncbi:MAG: hypothetical protein NVS4B12_17940 [Ktedonobacteraceae bacterium]